MFFKTISILILISLISACTSIKPLGSIGPKKLQVYAIKNDDFLTANRMLLVLDKKGNVVASTGGTEAGIGSIGLQTVGTIATGTAIFYGAKSIQNGLQNGSKTLRDGVKNINVKGIPNHFEVKTDSAVRIGVLKK